MPKFSIIIPIYNVEPYIRDCIESVLSQTFSDYELLLVDDGSPDQCGIICDEYAQKDSRIRVIHKKNGGLSDARNAGLELARGEYIYFLDGDDCISPNLLEKTVVEMDDGVDMVVFRFRSEKINYHMESSAPVSRRKYLLKTEECRFAFIQKVLLPCKIGWEAWARVFRKDIIDRYQIRFADNRKIFAEDLYFNLCYCAHISSISCIDEVLYYYRQRDDSIMGVQKKRNNMDRINELGKAVLEHYCQCGDCAMLIEQFHLAHTQIVLQQFINQLWTSGIEPVEFQRQTHETVNDWTFLEQQVRKTMKQKNLVLQLGSLKRALELRSHANYLMGGSWIALRIKCGLIRLLTWNKQNNR